MRSLNAKTDPAVLAREVVDKCDLIHKSQLSDVEQIIYYLKNRKEVPQEGNAQSSNAKSAGVRSTATAEKNGTVDKTVEKASIRNIEEYIELLYEELPERIRGSALILQLARNPDNLEELEKNGWFSYCQCNFDEKSIELSMLYINRCDHLAFLKRFLILIRNFPDHQLY